MIITYPIDIPYTKESQQRVMPDAMFNNSEILSGLYPMGKNRFWHGGVHVHPNDRTMPIRAIADGELVAYRYDDVDSTDAYFDKVPYSRSFVLLKHEAELGQTKLGTSKLIFYSLYMHLRAWGEVKGKTGADAIKFLRKNVPDRRSLTQMVTRYWINTNVQSWIKPMSCPSRRPMMVPAIAVMVACACNAAISWAIAVASLTILPRHRVVSTSKSFSTT